MACCESCAVCYTTTAANSPSRPLGASAPAADSEPRRFDLLGVPDPGGFAIAFVPNLGKDVLLSGRHTNDDPVGFVNLSELRHWLNWERRARARSMKCSDGDEGPFCLAVIGWFNTCRSGARLGAQGCFQLPAKQPRNRSLLLVGVCVS